jgi:hypothetical protein
LKKYTPEHRGSESKADRAEDRSEHKPMRMTPAQMRSMAKAGHDKACSDARKNC